MGLKAPLLGVLRYPLGRRLHPFTTIFRTQHNLAHKLKVLVSQRQFLEAQHLFASNTSLHHNQSALRAIMRSFVLRSEFSSARSFLFSVINEIGAKGVHHFIYSLGTLAQSSQDIASLFWRTVSLEWSVHDKSVVAGSCLLLLRVLEADNMPSAQTHILNISKWAKSSRLSPELTFLPLEIYDALLNFDFAVAHDKLEVLKEYARFNQDGLEIDVLNAFYFAMKRFASFGDVKSIEALAIPAKPACFSYAVATHLPPCFPEVPVHQWVQFLLDKGYELDVRVVGILVSHLAKRYSQLAGEIQEQAKPLLKAAKYSVWPARWSNNIPLFSAVGPFLHEIRLLASKRESTGYVAVLERMERLGLETPYYIYVHAFEAACAARSRQEADLVASKLSAAGFSRHCAGTDLSMLELELWESSKQQKTQDQLVETHFLGRQLVNDYLTQYPLSVHDLVQLTRVGYLYFRMRDPDRALHAVEYLRMSSKDQRYNARNCSSQSLLLTLKLLKTQRKPIEQWIDGVLSDSPLVLFDNRLNHDLRLASGKNDALSARLQAHNQKVREGVLQQVEKMRELLGG